MRLTLRTLSGIPEVCRPPVRPDQLQPGIVHIGLGAFHRAHQAVFTQQALVQAGGDWGIVGVAPRSVDVVGAMREQDGLFTVTRLRDGDASASATQVVGVHTRLLHALTEPAEVIAAVAAPTTRVVTLTVTEKAYRLDPATGRLRSDDPDLRADLSTVTEFDAPARTLPGMLLRGLAARAQADAGPLAVLCCDNLPDNGHRVAGMVTQALELLTTLTAGTVTAATASRLTEWVTANVAFPSSMVDRIVPATTPTLLERVERVLGVADRAAVGAEDFSQWVITDDFPGGRPAWEQAGAILTGDVSPWERVKLRLLNGAHSALAYLGALAGRATIADAIRLPGMHDFLTLLAQEVSTTLTPPPGLEPEKYAAAVRERFANSALGHRTIQVAMDGTQKLPQRVLAPLADLRTTGVSPRWTPLVLAGWMRFVRGYADDGSRLPLDDPLADRIADALRDAGGTDPASTVDALLGLRDVFPASIAEDPVIRSTVTAWLTELEKHGAAAVIAGIASRETIGPTG